jgi:hypothetical protein
MRADKRLFGMPALLKGAILSVLEPTMSPRPIQLRQTRHIFPYTVRHN